MPSPIEPKPITAALSLGCVVIGFPPNVLFFYCAITATSYVSAVILHIHNISGLCQSGFDGSFQKAGKAAHFAATIHLVGKFLTT